MIRNGSLWPRRIRRALLGLGLLLATGVVAVWIVDTDWLYDAPAPPDRPVSERALALHRSALVIDLHADTGLWDRRLEQQHRHGHVDFPRMRQGGVSAQAVTLASGTLIGLNALQRRWPLRTWRSPWHQIVQQIEGIGAQLAPPAAMLPFYGSSRARLARTAAEVRQNHREGLLSIFHGIEGAHALERDGADDLGRLEEAAARGVLFVAPVHFWDSQYGGHGGGKGVGLTPLGRQLVQRMNQLGLLVDTAHASSATLQEAVKLSELPPINSHTGVKARKDHWRNLSDEDIRAIGGRGGVIGLMFGGWATHTPSAAEVVDHIAHVVKVAGEDHAALGSDWDGYITPAVDAAGLPRLTELMLQRGWSETRIRKILGENVLRVWAERDRVLAARAKRGASPP